MGSFSGSSSWLSKHRVLVMAGVTLVVVTALALGLGLGLGLSNGSSDVVAASGCQNTSTWSQHSKTKADWKPKIPTQCPSQVSCPAGKTDPTLLVLSMDGFRADYLLRNMTPTLDFLIGCGVHAPYMRAVFPTKTFPNHYTLATGLYPESHGIVDNMFYDPVYKEVYAYGGANTSDNRWWGGEPIWNTAKKAGKKVATMMWPGSDVNIQNMRPDICYTYNETFSLDNRVTEVLSWFDGDPTTFPDLVMLYFEQPDSAGHSQGPFGDYVRGNLTYVDGLVNRLIDGFVDRNMFNCLNFVVVADHGMEGTDCDRAVDLSQYIDTTPYYVYAGVHAKMTSQYFYNSRQKGARRTVTENPNPVPVDETLSKLKCLNYNNSRDWYVRIHKKQDLPRRYHYINNRCIDEIVMDLEEDYYLGDYRTSSCSSSMSGGSHGADNTYKSMHAIFIASGPSFLRGSVVDGFENIEVYNLLSETLGLSASANNGTYGVLGPMLRSYKMTNDIRQRSYSDQEPCPFPEALDERENRRNSSDCVSSPPPCLGSKTVEQADSRLNLTVDEANDVIERHMPLGMPYADSDVCILAQTDYVSGYSSKFQMPLWTAFTFTPGSKSAILDGQYRTDSAFESCTRADVRLTNGTDCSSYYNDSIKISGSLFFPPGLASSNETISDGFLSTNLVPMYENFRAGVWKKMLHVLEEYSAKYGQLQVMFGPVFDYNADGLNDSVSELQQFTGGSGSVPIPSHYFATATFCNSTSLAPYDCFNATQILAFVLPHTQTDVNCRDQLPVPDIYLRQNTARLRDVELLTGLAFFVDGISSFHRAKLLTYLAEDLWPKLSWMDVDGDCPNLSNTNCPAGYGKPPLLLISLDGFRPDYLKKNLSPILDRLHRCGVSAPYMRSIYPTLTFPNHHTMSTGLYPESHGIIDNNMYDVKLNQSFNFGGGNAVNDSWWFGEPIWNTLVKNGKHAMTYFWPGSDVAIGGMTPTVWKPYDGTVPYSVRVDTALKWLNGSAGVYPDMVVLYFSKVDEGGHEGGPGSLQVDEAIEAVDRALQQLMDGIYRQKLHTCVNMLVVSDHGMSDISCSRSVLVGDYLTTEVLDKTYLYPGAAGRMSNKYRRSGNNYFHIPPEEQIPLQEIIDPLKCKDNMIALNKLQMPRRHHYINQDRIDDVQLLMADTWLVDRTAPWCAIKGQHGWDPEYQVMKALFIGYGPDFLEREEVEAFENIELYNLMARLTNVTAAPNNGTEGSLYHLLKRPPTLKSPEPGQEYQDCNFPANDQEYEIRANLTNTGCQCSVSNSEIRTYDNRLNLTEGQQDQLEIVHVSHGNPVAEYDDSICILHHSDFVSGYSHRLKMPVWTSFNLTSPQVNKNDSSVDCTRPDVRLSPHQQTTCLQYQKASENETSPVFLFPPKWSSSHDSAFDSLLLSNQVPMQKSFITDVWDLVISYFANITNTAGNLQIVFGPIFDYDGDGLLDNLTRLAEQSEVEILIPSHYYAIALHCGSGTCKDMNYDPLTFILPHWNNSRSENCQDIQPFLLQNVARIRDVELLTGLRFLTANLTQISIQRRVQTPEALWT